MLRLECFSGIYVSFLEFKRFQVTILIKAMKTSATGTARYSFRHQQITLVRVIDILRRMNSIWLLVSLLDPLETRPFMTSSFPWQKRDWEQSGFRDSMKGAVLALWFKILRSAVEFFPLKFPAADHTARDYIFDEDFSFETDKFALHEKNTLESLAKGPLTLSEICSRFSQMPS